jgi:small-conductance mechanosensitive channel
VRRIGKAHAWRAWSPKGDCGFESHPLRKMSFLYFESFLPIFFKLIKILIVLILIFSLNSSFSFFLKKYLKNIIKRKEEGERQKRIQTLLSTIGGTFSFIVWILFIFFVLYEFGINILPLIASLGLVGFAVSMAAKDILSDFISGIFVLLEDQYHVGDKIKVGNLEGEVVEFNLRRTIIKDENGVFHLIPNSQIKIVSKKVN